MYSDTFDFVADDAKKKVEKRIAKSARKNLG